METKKIHHMGFAVRDLDATVRVWEGIFGGKAVYGENKAVHARLASLVVGGVKFVFNESTKPGSRWEKYIEENGEGLEHIAFEVDDIDEGCGNARESGGTVRFEEHLVAHGAATNFIDDIGAAVIEFMEMRDGEKDDL